MSDDFSTTANQHMLRALAQAGGGAYEFFDTKTKHNWAEKVSARVIHKQLLVVVIRLLTRYKKKIKSKIFSVVFTGGLSAEAFGISWLQLSVCQVAAVQPNKSTSAGSQAAARSVQ